MSSPAFSNFLLCLDSTDLKLIQVALSTQSKQIDKQTFCGVLSTTIAKGNKLDYEELFDNIDISREGLVDWDTMSDHLLLGFYELDDRKKNLQIPEWKAIKFIPTPHKDTICKIITCDGLYKYCVVSKEGCVVFMDDGFNIKRTLKVIPDRNEMNARDLWVTDAIYMKNINKLVLSTTSKHLLFYDCSNKGDFACLYKLRHMCSIPLCLAYWWDPEAPDTAILAYGDFHGNIYVLIFSNAAYLFGKPIKNEDNETICQNISLRSIISGQVASVSCIKYRGHEDWVLGLMYIPLLECFISCSTSVTNSLVLGWIGKSKSVLRLTKFSIPLGINGFDYHYKMNLIATAGVSTHVCLWNPFVVSKPVGVLRAHMNVVVSVQFIHDKYQLLSLSKDRVICLWDVNMQLCIQRLLSVFPNGPPVNYVMHFDNESCCLLTSIGHRLSLLEVTKSNLKDRVVSHDYPVTDFVYNSRFGQVVSVSEGSNAIIWLLGTGQKVKTITDAHPGAEVTTVSLDQSQTRILTAGTDGTIKMWDINGTCHHVIVVDFGHPCEISQIMFLRRMVLAFGWSKDVCYIPHSNLKGYYCQPTPWKGKQIHTDDIIVADFIEPRTLVTASCDGDIVFWNTDTHISLRKISTCKKTRTNSIVLHSNRPRLMTRSKTREISSRLTRKSSRSMTPLIGLRKRSSTVDELSIIPVTSVMFLNKRKNADGNTADIYSCQSNGVVKFWNSQTCKKICEFQAFTCSGTLVSDVDAVNEFLCIGAENGKCKVWDIKTYGVFNSDLVQPYLYAEFSSHSEAITKVKFVEIHNMQFILTGSVDCSIVLHCFDHVVGIFGQEQHWNIKDFALKFEKSKLTKTNKGTINEEVGISASNTKTVPLDRNNKPSSRHTSSRTSNNSISAVENANNSIANDVTHHEKKLKKNLIGGYVERIHSLNSKRNIRTCASYGKSIMNGAVYRCLDTSGQISETKLLTKPDFIISPEIFFSKKTEQIKLAPLPTNGKLKHVFDEKTLFPEELREKELKINAVTVLKNSLVYHRKQSKP